ncbi:hypothetical protein Tco_0287748 [Tanacetum coccineum]
MNYNPCQERKTMPKSKEQGKTFVMMLQDLDTSKSFSNKPLSLCHQERTAAKEVNSPSAETSLHDEHYKWMVKSAILIWQITEELYVKQPPGFEGPAHPNKDYRVVKIKALMALHQPQEHVNSPKVSSSTSVAKGNLGTATSQGTAEIQRTADFQDFADQDAADTPDLGKKSDGLKKLILVKRRF